MEQKSFVFRFEGPMYRHDEDGKQIENYDGYDVAHDGVDITLNHTDTFSIFVDLCEFFNQEPPKVNPHAADPSTNGRAQLNPQRNDDTDWPTLDAVATITESLLSREFLQKVYVSGQYQLTHQALREYSDHLVPHQLAVLRVLSDETPYYHRFGLNLYSLTMAARAYFIENGRLMKHFWNPVARDAQFELSGGAESFTFSAWLQFFDVPYDDDYVAFEHPASCYEYLSQSLGLLTSHSEGTGNHYYRLDPDATPIPAPWEYEPDLEHILSQVKAMQHARYLSPNIR